MTHTTGGLQLVSDRSGRPDGQRTADETSIAFAAPRRTRRHVIAARLRELVRDDRGAITAEYAVVIMAAVAFAGLLVAIMRSSEIREMLVRLVENALGAGA